MGGIVSDFLSERERKNKKLIEKQMASKERVEEKRRVREMEFIHPSLLLKNDDGSGGGGAGGGGDAAALSAN